MPVSPRTPQTTSVGVDNLTDEFIDHSAMTLHNLVATICRHILRDPDDDQKDVELVPFAQLKEATKTRYRLLIKTLIARGLWSTSARLDQ